MLKKNVPLLVSLALVAALLTSAHIIRERDPNLQADNGQMGIDSTNEYTLIVRGNTNAFYCSMFGGYESEPSCEIFERKGNAYVDTGLSATNPDTTLLVSPDKQHILIITGGVNLGEDSSGHDFATILNVSDATHYVIYEAPDNTYLGLLDDNINFVGRGGWIDDSTIELKVYAADNAHEAGSIHGSTESKPQFIKHIQISK